MTKRKLRAHREKAGFFGNYSNVGKMGRQQVKRRPGMRCTDSRKEAIGWVQERSRAVRTGHCARHSFRVTRSRSQPRRWACRGWSQPSMPGLLGSKGRIGRYRNCRRQCRSWHLELLLSSLMSCSQYKDAVYVPCHPVNFWVGILLLVSM